MDSALGATEFQRHYRVQGALSAAVRLAGIAGDREGALLYATNQALVGQDFRRRGTLGTALVGMLTEKLAGEAMAKILGDSPIRKQALDHVAARLLALRKARLPVAAIWRAEQTLLQGRLADDSQAEQFLRRGYVGGKLLPVRTWRNLYSSRIARSNALRTLETLPTELPQEVSREPRDRAIPELSRHGDWLRTIRSIGTFSLCGQPRSNASDRGTRAQHSSSSQSRSLDSRPSTAPGPRRESDLVPRYLAAIPTSPMDPGGLRFAVNKAWSRGPDGDDDGGRALSAPYDGFGDGDIVVEVKGHR